MSFSKDFIWGAASAAYQIEGGAYEDGKGLSVWDMRCRQPGAIANGDTGDVACDSYHLFRDDIRCMKEVGIKAYRFSVSWPRLIPDGYGDINKKGLLYYERLIDSLLENDIIPYVTLFHWDYPYELYKKGGWLNPDSPKWFGEYACLVSRKFSDRVKNFITINEPQCFIGLSYSAGEHAPGLKLSHYDTLSMAHNTLLAHGNAVRAIRDNSNGPVNIGIAPTGSFFYPKTNNVSDIDAARQATFAINPDTWYWSVSWWSDPVFKGCYPADGISALEKYMPHISASDFKIISEPIDFLGQNIYNGGEIESDPSGNPRFVNRYAGYPKTAVNWPVTPESLYWGPTFLYERYGKPIYITENGVACNDSVSLDGAIHDTPRIDFLHKYLRCLKQATDNGTDIRGYFHWSLTDNFEWCSGFSERFGLCYTDYITLSRTVKDSGRWYKKVIETNGEIL